ncbi:MAG: YlbF family regulator [Chloroflexi bacterium]|nr:YlbF family regulator [Chloroflexota bacterium]
MTPQNDVLKGNLEIAVKNLAASIQYTEPVNRYLNAKEKFNQDQTAHNIMEELSIQQRYIRQKQADNSITTDDLEKLRSLQVKAQENRSINTYAYAQQEAIGYLREINSEISNLLGIDFASLAKNTSC